MDTHSHADITTIQPPSRSRRVGTAATRRAAGARYGSGAARAGTAQTSDDGLTARGLQTWDQVIERELTGEPDEWNRLRADPGFGAAIVFGMDCSSGLPAAVAIDLALGAEEAMARPAQGVSSTGGSSRAAGTSGLGDPGPVQEKGPQPVRASHRERVLTAATDLVVASLVSAAKAMKSTEARLAGGAFVTWAVQGAARRLGLEPDAGFAPAMSGLSVALVLAAVARVAGRAARKLRGANTGRRRRRGPRARRKG